MKLRYRILLFFFLLTWCAGIFSGYFASINKNILLAHPFIKKSYSLVCHQEESKLIYFDGYATNTCARCTGIYIGLLLASLLSIFKTTSKIPGIKYLFIFAVPMLIDVILYSIGIYKYSKEAAFATGLLFGSIGFLYFYTGVNELLNEIRLRE